MKKRISVILIAALTVCTLMGCSSGKSEASTDKEKEDHSKSDVKVALIASSSGLGDRSFNDAAWEGFQKAEKDLGVEIKVVEPKDVSDYANSASSLANAGYSLIFATGNDWGDTLTEVAKQYPDINFVGLNVQAEGDNVAIAQTADNEIGFVVGALAAMMSKTGTVGFLGGKEVPSQVRFNVGYSEGVAYVNQDVKVLTSYVGAFNDPTTGKEFAMELANQGADIIFHTAGQSGSGLFEAIQGMDDVYAIGVDSNQDALVKGKVLTTAEKRLQTIAYDMIKKQTEGAFESGIVVYDLKNGGVGITDMEYTKDYIGEENIAALNDIMEKIKSGDITVTDVYDEK